MKKSVNSIRVAMENWLSEDRFNKFLELLEKNSGEIGQVALFTQSNHTPMPLEKLKRYSEIMKVRMEVLREHGFDAGINILCTIGHLNENLDSCYQDDTYRITNIKGEVAEGVHCMRDSVFLENYVKPAYTYISNAKPDFIWVDDDVRVNHPPVGNGCFCNGCIEAFNKKHGCNYTREELRKEFNNMNIPLRKLWLEHNGESVTSLLKFIADTVRGISKDIMLGFMTGARFFENFDFKACADALSENGKYPIMWRPGCGVYTDISIENFYGKMREIGIQSALLPDYVISNQSEIENFPYQLIKKSPYYTALEGLLYMTAGCTGVAFNILPSETLEPIENCKLHLEAINRMSNEYKLFNQKLEGMIPYGIGNNWKTDAQAYTVGEWGDTYVDDDIKHSTELFNFGLPECYSKKGSVCSTLTEFTVSTLTDDEIMDVLSNGVYMDAGALNLLNKRGFGEYTGFEVDKEIEVDGIETYLDNKEFNYNLAGCKRNCRQSFNDGPCIAIKPTNENAIPLCGLIDYEERKTADCSMGVFENKLGGRIAVEGYYPFSWISDYTKATQLIRVFLYLSKGQMPAYIDGYYRLKNATFVKENKICVTLFNPTPDTVVNIPLNVNTKSNKATAYCGNSEVAIECSDKTENYSKFIIPEIPPFKIALIEIDT